MGLSSNFSMADIVLLNELYWLLSFIRFVMLTLFCYFVEFVSLWSNLWGSYEISLLCTH